MYSYEKPRFGPLCQKWQELVTAKHRFRLTQSAGHQNYEVASFRRCDTRPVSYEYDAFARMSLIPILPHSARSKHHYNCGIDQWGVALRTHPPSLTWTKTRGSSSWKNIPIHTSSRGRPPKPRTPSPKRSLCHSDQWGSSSAPIRPMR